MPHITLLVIQSVSAQWLKKLSLQEVLDHITDQENSGSIAGIEEETTEDESYSEDALQDILEEENITEMPKIILTLLMPLSILPFALLQKCLHDHVMIFSSFL